MSQRRVSHPILRLHIVAPDGTLQTDNHVFCRKTMRSTEVEVCCQCLHCEAITDGARAAVECLIPAVAAAPLEDPGGEHTPIGTLLTGGMVAVSGDATVGAAVRLMRAEGLQSLAVVDGEHALVGLVRERGFLGAGVDGPSLGLRELGLRDAMSTPVAVHEQISIRSALRVLASHHLREIAVISSKGAPLGVFRDVDGLHWIALSQRATRPP